MKRHWFSATFPSERSLIISFIELIEEIITGDSASTLPRPPRPPADLLPQLPNSHNHAMLRQNSSSQPVLVARGTGCQVSGSKSIPVCLRNHLCCCVCFFLVSASVGGFLHFPEWLLATPNSQACRCFFQVWVVGWIRKRKWPVMVKWGNKSFKSF